MFLLLAAPTSAPSSSGTKCSGLALEDLKMIHKTSHDMMQSECFANPFDSPQIKYLEKSFFLYLDCIAMRMEVLEQQHCEQQRPSAVVKFVIVQADPAKGVEEVSEKWCSEFFDFDLHHYRKLSRINFKSGFDKIKMCQFVSLLQYEIRFTIGENGQIQKSIPGTLLLYWYSLRVSDFLSAGAGGDTRGVPKRRKQPPPRDNAACMNVIACDWEMGGWGAVALGRPWLRGCCKACDTGGQVWLCCCLIEDSKSSFLAKTSKILTLSVLDQVPGGKIGWAGEHQLDYEHNYISSTF
jgi:hypothetical protein